ncbi:MAG: acyl carrier protein [Vicinamibacteria bacterium]
MSDERKLAATIQRLFQELFDVPAERLTDKTRRGELERWDSLGHLRLVGELSDAFGIEIPPDSALEMETVEDIKRIVSGILERT